MTTLDLTRFRALSFDCYGTLIDWESGIWCALQPLLAQGADGPDRRQALAAFARAESAQEQATPGMRYEQILERVHQTLAAEFDLSTTQELDRHFGASVPDWPAFDDSAEALDRLAQRYRLIILSNVSEAGIAASIERIGLADATFDAVYTAERIGSYKPSARNFDFLIRHLDSDLEIEASRILHVAQSLFHDHVPAREAGLATAWIDRQNLSGGGEWGATAVVEHPPQPDFVWTTLAECADAVDSAFGNEPAGSRAQVR